MSEFLLDEYLQKLQAATSIDDCPKVPVPDMAKGQNYVFVSYSHKDYKEVYHDLAHLYDQGVRFWYDKGLSAGEDWENEVKAHIQSPCCCGVIFYLSQNMFLSSSIFKEIQFTTQKKRPNILLQKNYFCVNLQDGNISDMLFSVQEIQRNQGLARLDTKKLNTLTSTFSDDDTYIKYASSYHVEELIEQIQNKFDVTSKAQTESGNPLALESINDPRLAFFALSEKETNPGPLFRYLFADYKKSKRARPWSLLWIGLAVGVITVLAAMYLLCRVFPVSWLSATMENYGIVATVICCLAIPYLSAKAFWLFYVSPVRRNTDHGVIARILHCLVYFLSTVLFALLFTAIAVISFFLAGKLVARLMK